MINRYSILFAGLAFFVPVAVFAQTPSRPSVADQAWASLSTFRQSVSAIKADPGSKNLVQATAEQKQRAIESRKVAEAANDFYTRYANHPNAAMAKKLEALATLGGITDDDPDYEQSALGVAQAYRTNAKNAIGDRFDVAVLIERLLLSRRLNSPLFVNNPAGLERIAGGLRREFGDIPDVYRFYVNVARSADMVAADRIAQLVVSSSASPEIRAEAMTIMERRKMIGQPLAFVLTSVEGKPIDLARRNDQPTILFLWSAAMNPSSLMAAKRFLKTSAADCRWIYVSAESTLPQVDATKHLAPFPGTHCFIPPGAGVPLLDHLRNRHFPCVYVINRRGLLTGFGPVEDLPGLLENANR